MRLSCIGNNDKLEGPHDSWKLSDAWMVFFYVVPVHMHEVLVIYTYFCLIHFKTELINSGSGFIGNYCCYFAKVGPL